MKQVKYKTTPEQELKKAIESSMSKYYSQCHSASIKQGIRNKKKLSTFRDLPCNEL
jgi:hypothetical protein